MPASIFLENDRAADA